MILIFDKLIYVENKNENKNLKMIRKREEN